MAVKVFETGAAKWVSLKNNNGYTSRQDDAEVFETEQEANKLLSSDSRFSWLVGKTLEFHSV